MAATPEKFWLNRLAVRSSLVYQAAMAETSTSMGDLSAAAAGLICSGMSFGSVASWITTSG